MPRLASRLLLCLGLLWAAAGCQEGSAEAPVDDPAPAPEPAAKSPQKPVSAARARLEKSCENGEPQACFQLAEMLDRGEGGPADPDRARALYGEACAGGSYEACDALGH